MQVYKKRYVCVIHASFSVDPCGLLWAVFAQIDFFCVVVFLEVQVIRKPRVSNFPAPATPPNLHKSKMAAEYSRKCISQHLEMIL